MENDLSHVRNVMTLLEEHGIKTWLFGGWAEELHGTVAPRSHNDVDLLYPAINFALVDHFMQMHNVQEIVTKRLPHKRAFVFDEVMTEIIIVQPDLTTTFWGHKCHAWSPDIFDYQGSEIRTVSPTAIAGYRAAYKLLHKR